VLGNSIKYLRLAGFYSSSSLAIAAKGISRLIRNNGVMKLIVSPKLIKEDYEILLRTNEDPRVFLEHKLSEELDNFESECIRDHVYVLGWMVANHKLEIKVAMPSFNKAISDYNEEIQKGIFHQKVGIFEDVHGDILSFSGSINETASGWLDNIEEFKVFKSWELGEIDYVNEDKNKFDTFWNDNSNRARTYPLPEAIEKRLIKLAPKDISIVDLEKWDKKRPKSKKPILFKQQQDAIRIWIENGFRGLFEMATGTGKTFAAIGCLDKVFSKEKRIVAVVVCPYNHLIRQWLDSLEKYEITQIKKIICDKTNPKWKIGAFDIARDLNNGFVDRAIVFTTHSTFSSTDFIELVKLLKTKSLLIVDEVHGAGAPIRKIGFIDKYNFRLGLSATPSRWLDPEGTETILSYFGVKDQKGLYSFSIRDALKNINPATGKTYLAPYEYRPNFVELSDQELLEYIDFTKKIARAIFKLKNQERKFKDLTLILEARQKIIRNAFNKYGMFKEILDELKNIAYTLVYCSPEQIDKVQEILRNRNILQHKFTMKEGTKPEAKYKGLSEREALLEDFAEGTFGALVAMKCLDEGVDIPQARIGIILASSGNPIQYIQRRGRLLRHFPGKDKAIIYDFIVLPPIDSIADPLIVELEKKILAREFKRYLEFAEISINSVQCLRLLKSVKERLGIY
jgi:superfamily II DNA or RNA helicase